MLEADGPAVVQNSTGRGQGGTALSRGAVRLVDEEPDYDRLQSPRDATAYDRPIGTPDRPAFDDISHHANLNNNAQPDTPNASLNNRRRVGDEDAHPPQRNRSASTSPHPVANGNSPPPTNRAAEALQRELNRQRGRGGAAGRGRGGAQPRNRLARRGANNDDSDRSSGDEDNAANANPENGGAGGGSRNGAPSTARPKKNRLTNGEILTRPHVVLQSHTLQDDTIAAIDPSANQPKNYYGNAYGHRGLNVGKPAMKQAITLDSDWKFPLFPGGCSVLACCQTRCEIVRLWGAYGNADVEGSEKGALGFCCKALGGHNVDGQNYRRPRVLVPLRNPTPATSNPNYGVGGGGEFTMSHGDEEMQPVDQTTPSPNRTHNHSHRGSSSSSSDSANTSSSRRMLITMIVLDVLSLGIPCGPFYNGMGTAIFGCWSRWQIRRKYRIEGYGWQDGIVMCCFPGCALHQHRNEIEFNQILMSSFGGAREMM